MGGVEYRAIKILRPLIVMVSVTCTGSTNTDVVFKQYYVGLQALAMAILIPYMTTAKQFFPVFENQWRYVSPSWCVYTTNTGVLNSCPPMCN